LHFRAQAKDIEEFFKNKKIVNISIPMNNEGKSKGFGYV
jgi:RNA recognition motif-containing protein